LPARRAIPLGKRQQKGQVPQGPDFFLYLPNAKQTSCFLTRNFRHPPKVAAIVPAVGNDSLPPLPHTVFQRRRGYVRKSLNIDRIHIKTEWTFVINIKILLYILYFLYIPELSFKTQLASKSENNIFLDLVTIVYTYLNRYF
jgi:hypothetical protein